MDLDLARECSNLLHQCRRRVRQVEATVNSPDSLLGRSLHQAAYYLSRPSEMMDNILKVQEQNLQRSNAMGYDIPKDHHGSLPNSDTAAKRYVCENPNEFTNKPTREDLIAGLAVAQKQLQQVVLDAQKISPLAANIPIFQQIEATAKTVAEQMQQVARLRGL